MKKDRALDSADGPGRIVPSLGGAGGAAGRTRNRGRNENAAARGEAIKAFKRSLILDAARQVFADRGLENASVRTIAAMAGCTTGAIYPYFKGKEEIYGAILSDSLISLYESVSEAAATGRSSLERLTRSLRSFFEYYRARPSEVALGLYLFGGVKATGLTPELDRQLNHQLLNVLNVFADCIRDVSPLGEEEIRTEMSAAFTYLIGLLILYHTHRLKILIVDADRLIDHYVGNMALRLQK